MVIELTPEQEQLIAGDAALRGVAPSEIVQDILRGYEHYRADYAAAVQRGIAAADAGDVVEHDEFFDGWERDSPDSNKQR
jgi:predicted transcriptional regulator